MDGLPLIQPMSNRICLAAWLMAAARQNEWGASLRISRSIFPMAFPTRRPVMEASSHCDSIDLRMKSLLVSEKNVQMADK